MSPPFDETADRTGPDLLSALADAGPPAALVDADDRIVWCSQAFAGALTGGTAAELHGRAVSAVLSGAGAPPWRLDRRAAGAGRWLLQLEPGDEAAALRQRVADLQERLDLVQAFCRAGVFERDPDTMQGWWDAHMYRNFGLPVPAPGTPAPPYAEVSTMLLREDRKPGAFRRTLDHAGVHADRVRLRRPDGSVRHLHSQWKVIHDAQGRPVRVLGVNTDDTEVFELARRADEMRDELDLISRLGNIGLWRHDLATDRVYYDERACVHLGLPHSAEGLSREVARALIHPDDLPALNASYDTTLRTGVPTDMSLRYRRAGGGWTHMLLRRMLQRDDQGRPAAFLGVLLDETERVEKARREAELSHRLESAAEAARIGLWSSGVDGGLPDWNRRMFELFGLDPATPPLPMNTWIRQCVHADDREALREQATRWLCQGQEPIELAFRVVRRNDGALRWLVVRGAIVPQAADTPRRVEGVAIDISEQREVMERLRETAERVALTASAVGLGSWESDVRTGVSTWDDGMFRLRGIRSSPRPIGREEAMTFVHPDDRDAVRQQLEQLARSDGVDWRMNFRVRWPDGTVRWLVSRSVPVFDDRGRLHRRLGLNWDVTESVLSEQANHERERAVAESRAKSQFLSRVSHELRTPLNAVLGFTQLLRGDGGRADPDLRQRWLDHVDQAGRHLLALIDDVLDLSRVAAGEMHLNLQPVALDDLVQSTLPLIEQQARAAQVSVVVQGERGRTQQADPLRLRQVLLNLLSNAVKYNRRDGQVCVSVDDAGDGRVALRVADSGRGLDPAAIRSAFEPFNRLGIDGGAIEGTGIGLAIAKALVEHMGGRIEVQSQPGVGSEFTVLLPAGDGDAPAPPQVQPAHAVAPVPAVDRAGTAVRPGRVLYIEDNLVNALLVQEVLVPHPWVQLSVAADGRSGLQMALHEQPDLVLLDMQLPDMSGEEVLHALRSEPATAALRCVALSANAMPDDVDAAMRAGAMAYWTKPIDFPAFVSQVAALLGRS